MVHRRTTGFLVRPALGCVGLLAVFLSVGCASNGSGDSAEAYRAAADRNQALLQRVESLESANAELRRSLDECNRTVSEQRQAVLAATGERDDIATQLNQFDDRLRSVRGFGPVDPITDAALADLAARNPGLMIYDSEVGRIRMTSDLTFRSGYDTVQDGAKGSLADLARVLNTSEARQYDIRIVGHTDAKWTGAARNRGFKSNVHLSASRSIAVFEELRGIGIEPARMEVAGRGEYYPVVANGPDGDAPANRRVELYLVKAMPRAAYSVQPMPATAPAGGSSSATVPTNEPEIMK